MKSSLPIPRLLVLFAWLIIAVQSNAQSPSFSCYITNETQVSSTVYQFDLYLLGTGTNAFLYAGGQWGITVNSSVANGGTLTPSIVSGSSTLSNSNQVPISVTLPSSTYIFNIFGRTPPGAGNASVISNVNNGCSSPGTRIATLRVTNSVPFAVSSHMNHTFNFVAASGATQTAINAYVGSLNTDITSNGTFYDYLTSGSCLQNISLNCNLAASVTNTNVACFGGSNGTATISTSGGSSPFSYHWNNGQTSQTATGLSAGNYSATITDAGGCTATVSVAISQPSSALSASSTVISNVSSCGGNNGSISVSASGGTSPYNGTGTFTGLSAGTYTYTVTDAHGCTATTSSTITQSGNSLTASCSGTNVSCSGNGSDGSVSVSANGGTPSYSYLWNNGATTASVSNLSAGIYSVTVTDAGGCSATCSRSVNACNHLTMSLQNCSQPTCNTIQFDLYVVSDGSIGSDLRANAFQYGINFNTGILQSGATVTPSYVSGSSDFIPPLAAFNFPASTYPDHIRIVEDPYTSGNTGTTMTLGHQYKVGTFILTSSAKWVGSSNPSFALQSSVLGGKTVSAAVVWIGNAATAITISNTGTGNNQRSVVVSCSLTLNPCNLSASVSSTPASCVGNNGTATVSASGGCNPTFTYLWSNGQTDQTATGLTAGNYSVTVTDDLGCTTTTSVTIMQSVNNLTTTCSGTDVSCSNGSSGSVSVSASGGTPSYSYLWSNGATTASVSNLGAGTYSVTVTDAGGCSATCSHTINPCNHLTMSLQNCSQPTCNSIQFDLYVVSDGSSTSDLRANSFQYGINFNTTILQSGATITTSYVSGSSDFIPPLNGFSFPSSGSPDHIRIIENPYTGSNTGTTMTVGHQYKVGTFVLTSSSKWTANSNPSFALQASIATGKTVSAAAVWVGSAATPITISTTGTGNNQRSLAISCSITLNPCNLSASASSTPASCGGNNGTATVSATGGCNATFTYLWSNGQTTQTATGLASGNYSVTVTDDLHCTATTTVTVGQISQLIASQTHTNVSCHGGSNGSATISASGGTTPYSGTGTFTGLTAGNYTYNVTDANGCTASTTVTISEPTSLSAFVSQNTPILCHGGSATITVSGSGGTSSYSGTGTFSVTAGSYGYTITDAHGCTASASITITEPAALSASSSVVSNVSCNGGSNGSVSVAASGGTAPYSGTGTFSVSAGTYSYTVTDANGCTANTSVTVTQPPALSASVSQNTPILCHGGSTTVTVSASGGTPAYSGTGTFSVTAGSYNYTVTDAHGCTAVASITVTQPAAINVSAGSNTPVCTGNAINLTSSASGGTGSLSYSWTGPNGFSSTAANPTISSSSLANGGTYTLTVSDGNSCSTTVTTAVVVQNCVSTLNLRAFLQGFYRGGSTMVANLYNLGYNGSNTVTDTVQINLWAPTHLGNAAPDFSVKTLLHVNGTASATFNAAVIGNSYYIAVRHRNHLETWSLNPVTFASVTNYDFTTSESMAFGDGINPPMKNMGGGVFAFYGGDENQDGNIDISDMGDIDNATQAFAFGYNPTDINGDGATDVSDMAIVDNNSQLFLYFARPY